jgi:regulator of replication initiation timing
VMFGDNVPQERAESAKEAARTCDALLAMLITKGYHICTFLFGVH